MDGQLSRFKLMFACKQQDVAETLVNAGESCRVKLDIISVLVQCVGRLFDFNHCALQHLQAVTRQFVNFTQLLEDRETALQQLCDAIVMIEGVEQLFAAFAQQAGIAETALFGLELPPLMLLDSQVFQLFDLKPQ